MPEKISQLTIKGATLVSSSGRQSADVAIEEHKIVRIAPKLPESPGGRTLHAKGLYLIPGVIDSQVHFRDPGREHKEDFETGSRAAAMGGVTTVLDMPNTHPSTTTPEKMEEKFDRVRKKCIVNFGLFVGATGENVPEIKKCLEKKYCHGIKIFLGSSTGDLLLYDPDKLLQILQECPWPIAVHSESEAISPLPHRNPRLRLKRPRPPSVAQRGKCPEIHPNDSGIGPPSRAESSRPPHQHRLGNGTAQRKQKSVHRGGDTPTPDPARP